MDEEQSAGRTIELISQLDIILASGERLLGQQSILGA